MRKETSKYVCRKCQRDAHRAAENGAYLSRVNKGEVPSIWECAPSCSKTGNQDDAVIRAITDGDDE